MLYFYNMSTAATEDSVFKALANPMRRRILDGLKEEPRTTGMLCEAFPEIDRCTVMQHLKVLEEADLIIVRREGRERWNHLNAMPIKQIHDRWISQYATHALSVLDKLKSDLGG
jgi:DNA-binding transcriptional ArsR family regulator